MKKQMQTQKGFTLIELIVVIAILAILAGVAIPKFLGITLAAKQAAFKADIGTLRAGVSMFAAHQAATTGALTYPTRVQLGGTPAAGQVLIGVLEPPAAGDFFERGWTYVPGTGLGTFGTGGGTFTKVRFGT